MTDPAAYDERDVLAGELALRVLSPGEEAAARRLQADDAAFASQVDRWNDRLADMADEIAPVTPSAGVWMRIAVAVGLAAENDNGVIFWRRWAVASTGLLAASLVAVAVLALQPARVVTAPTPVAPVAVTRVATLQLEDGATAVTLVYDSGTGSLFLAPSDMMAGDTRVPHLWLVMPEGGVRLVGAIDGVRTSRHSLKGSPMSDMAMQAQAVAISMEAPGHTPATDKPDGPVVASGDIQQL